MAAHSSTPARRIPLNRRACRATVHGVTKRHNLATEYTGSVFTLAEITESNVSSVTSPYRRFVSKNKIHSVM